MNAAAHNIKQEHIMNTSPKNERTGKDIVAQEHMCTFHWLTDTVSTASLFGMDEIVARLLSLGASPNPSEYTLGDHESPLHRAAKRSQLGTVKLLVDAGASLTAITKRIHGTPLHIAAAFGSHEIVRFLLTRGAPIDAKHAGGWTPLQDACDSGHYAAAEVILEHRKFQEYLTPDLPNQPLVLATRRGRYKVVETLLHHDADPNIPDPGGETALWHAVVMKRIDICRLLLENNADPNLAPDNMTPPLIEAARDSLEITRLLVEKGADLEKREPPGTGWLRTPCLSYLPCRIMMMLIISSAYGHFL